MERLTKRISENLIELSAKANPIQYNGSPQRVHIKHPFWNVFNKLCDYEDAEEQGLLLRLPCRLGDIIDRIISHNETVTLMFETEVSSFRGLKHFWHGAAWNIPKEYLELPFVKIHGVVPDKITEADTIWIEVRKEAEQALARMEGENE